MQLLPHTLIKAIIIPTHSKSPGTTVATTTTLMTVPAYNFALTRLLNCHPAGQLCVTDQNFRQRMSQTRSRMMLHLDRNLSQSVQIFLYQRLKNTSRKKEHSFNEPHQEQYCMDMSHSPLLRSFTVKIRQLSRSHTIRIFPESRLPSLRKSRPKPVVRSMVHICSGSSRSLTSRTVSRNRKLIQS